MDAGLDRADVHARPVGDDQARRNGTACRPASTAVPAASGRLTSMTRRQVTGASASGSPSWRSGQDHFEHRDGPLALGERGVQRARGEPQQVWRAEVGDHAAVAQRRDSFPAAGWVRLTCPPRRCSSARGHAPDPEPGEPRPRRVPAGTTSGPATSPEPLQAGVGNQLQRPDQRGEAEDVRRAHQVAAGVLGRPEFGGHHELPHRVAAEPAGEPGEAAAQPRVGVQPAGRTRAAVEVLIGAAEREVDLVEDEAVGDDPRGVRAVPGDEDAALAGRRGDRPHVEELPSRVDHRREHREPDAVHRRDDAILVEQPIGSGLHDDQPRRVETVQPQVALDRVPVRGEVRAVHQDSPRRLVERGEQLVQVDGRRLPDHYEVCIGTEQRGEQPGYLPRQPEPRLRPFRPAADGERPPRLDRFAQARLRRPAEQPERVAVHVNGARGLHELAGEAGERVGGVRLKTAYLYKPHHIN